MEVIESGIKRNRTYPSPSGAEDPPLTPTNEVRETYDAKEEVLHRLVLQEEVLLNHIQIPIKQKHRGRTHESRGEHRDQPAEVTHFLWVESAEKEDEAEDDGVLKETEGGEEEGFVVEGHWVGDQGGVVGWWEAIDGAGVVKSSHDHLCDWSH
ncbi:hypothetical protein SAICODRAFT_30685 [Saitoella complicata NRRL Y-17804]|uniref:uncharacterized protein n=1 Tax=Saitoella complicata (strain BCRC 22490 / CBS 7301 / JCM 7358 / NBRC 10748 / NRRL Y-17804) TaxID=698492 RepID=UPI000867543D|nr:uncharacterized protein SAICODRAFT_30685 [Saitoella complicata NRRL Y-17804]ODQ52563.1 hypothetical protein SAICODRAFT_30685 [Saitoella complicata NRRL Y-17804]